MEILVGLLVALAVVLLCLIVLILDGMLRYKCETMKRLDDIIQTQRGMTKGGPP